MGRMGKGKGDPRQRFYRPGPVGPVWHTKGGGDTGEGGMGNHWGLASEEALDSTHEGVEGRASVALPEVRR